MYLVVGTYQGSPSDRYLLAFPVLIVVELQLIEIVTKCTLCKHSAYSVFPVPLGQFTPRRTTKTERACVCSFLKFMMF